MVVTLSAGALISLGVFTYFGVRNESARGALGEDLPRSAGDPNLVDCRSTEECAMLRQRDTDSRRFLEPFQISGLVFAGVAASTLGVLFLWPNAKTVVAPTASARGDAGFVLQGEF